MEANNDVNARLAAFGEAFMNSIFDDRPTKEGGKPKQLSAPRPGDESLVTDTKRRPKKKSRKQTGTASSSTQPAAQEPSGEDTAHVQEKPARPAREPAGPGLSKAERRRFMSGKIADIRPGGSAGSASSKKRKEFDDPEKEKDFNKTLREVMDFIRPQLDKNTRSQWERERVLALGGTVEKRQKMNYRYLQRKAKQLGAERKAKAQEDKVMGIPSSQGLLSWQVDKVRKKKREMGKQKRQQRDGLLKLGMGAYEKKGLATIPERAVRTFQRKGKR